MMRGWLAQTASDRIGVVGRSGAASAGLNVSAAALDLVAFALAARILPVEQLGVFLIALSVGTLAERLGSTNLGPTLIRHVVRGIEQNEPGDLRRLLGLAARFDGLLLVLAAAAGSVAAVFLGDGTTVAMIIATALVPAVRLPLSSIAMARAFGRHEAVMARILAGSALKVIILAVALNTGLGLAGVVAAFLAWRIVTAVGGLSLTVASARRHGVFDAQASPRQDFLTRHPDLWRTARLNAATAVPQAAVEFSTSLVGILSGVAAAGTFGLALKVGQTARMYVNPISYVLYTEQCKALEAGDTGRFLRLTLRWSATLMTVTAAGLAVFLAADEWFVGLAFGSDYLPATAAIAWCVAAAIPESAATPLHFALWARGASRSILASELAAAALFFAILVMMETPKAADAAMVLAISRCVLLALLGVSLSVQLTGGTQRPAPPPPA